MTLLWPILLTLAALLAAPWLLALRRTIPRGWVRASYVLGRLAGRDVWLRDPAGGALVAAAWALGRRRTLAPEQATKIEARLQRLAPLRGGGVLAAGLL